MISRNPGAPGWVHGLIWGMYRAATNMGFKKVFKKWHAAHDLPPVRSVWEHVIGETVLLACDEIFGTHPEDASPRCVLLAFQPGPDDGAPLSPEVEAFLEAGPPPLYAGFGSMPGGDPRKTADALIAGARDAGHRIILGSGWAALGAEATADDVLQIGYEPFSKLFTKVAAVIHHGGAGTTSTAARAGAPQWVVPHMGDQFFFGHQVSKLGIGVAPTPLVKLTARRVTEVVARLGDETIKRTAGNVANELRGVDGVGRAVAAIERALEG